MNIFNATAALSLFSTSSGSGGTDTSWLTNYYDTKAGLTGAGTSASNSSSSAVTGPTTKSNSPTGSDSGPTAPWNASDATSQDSALFQQVMQGQAFIKPSRVTSDALNADPDYNKLFALYQGLDALQQIATAAQATNVSPYQMTQYQQRFAEGLSEVQNYISGTTYSHVQLTPGTLTTDLKNTVGTARTNSTYVAQNIQTGSTSTAVAAFQGDVQFTITAQKTGTKNPINVNIDLSNMGNTTRSMSNVVSYINGQLKAAGLSTRFAVNMTPATPVTSTVNGTTTTIDPGQPSYGLQINGVPYETLTLSAPSTADSVYVTQATGDPTKTPTSSSSSSSSSSTSSSSTSSTTATAETDVTSQLVKFQTTDNATGSALAPTKSQVGDTYWVAGEAVQSKLDSAVVDVNKGNTTAENTVSDTIATATGSDGSVYMLSNVNGTLKDGETIKGTQDVALTKYDSAGNVVYTRLLGASDTASGYALAVSNDGKVAITGTVTGALNVNNATTTLNQYGLPVKTGIAASTASLSGSDPTTPDTFVTVYDSSGNESWTQRLTASATDQPTTIAFGSNDSVYVGGKTKSTMPGATTSSQGGYDAYVVGFSGTGQKLFTQQSGTANDDSTAQIAVSGNTMYVASLQNNEIMLNSYDISSGKPVQTGSRDLGGIGGGNISGISIYNGQVYLGGSSANANLIGSTANVTKASSGGYDAFALSVSSNLSDTSSDTVAYYGGSGSEQNAQVAFSGGNAWIAGQTTGDIAGTTKIGKQDGYLAELNVSTGQVLSQTRNSGTDGMVTTTSIAVASGASSVLDRLGLPQGTIMQTDSNLITANSSVRAGDKFYMVDPSSGAKQTITIDPGETMATLAKKIQRASSYQLNVTVSKVIGQQQDQLDIQPSNSSSSMEFLSGPAGQDALAGLGLSPGIVSDAATAKMDSSSVNYTTSQKLMALDFNSSLNLNSKQNIADALTSLKQTITKVQNVYTYLRFGDPKASTSSNANNSSGTVPAYLTNQIANYKAALLRLTGSAG